MDNVAELVAAVGGLGDALLLIVGTWFVLLLLVVGGFLADRWFGDV